MAGDEPTWHLRPGADLALPEAIPEQLEASRAPGGVIAHFYDGNGGLLCQCARGDDDWLLAFKSDELLSLLAKGEDVIAIAYDGDDGRLLVVLDLDVNRR